MDYITRLELKDYIGGIAEDNPRIDNIIDQIILTTTEAITGYTGRRFWKDVDGNGAPVLSSRVYFAEGGTLWVDDIADTATATVAIDAANNGSYSTTWVENTQFRWLPLNGIMDGQEGWPATHLSLIGSFWFWPFTFGRPQVRITAQWGWQAIPATIKSVALLTAADLLAYKDIRFDVAGSDVTGFYRAKANAKVAELLNNGYCRSIPGIA